MITADASCRVPLKLHSYPVLLRPNQFSQQTVERMGGCVGKSGPDDFDNQLLRAHNVYRAKHGSPALRWSPEAAKAAQRWANHLASINKLQHGDHQGMGQNLAYKSGAELTGQQATDMWYNEISQYNFSNPGFSHNTGHFTQLVWAATTHVGSARATKGTTTFVVANYSPPGNVQGKQNYLENVKRAK